MMTFIIALLISAVLLVGGLYVRILFRLTRALQITGSDVDVIINKAFLICGNPDSAKEEKQKWLIAMIRSGMAKEYYLVLEVVMGSLKMRMRKTKNPFEIGSLIQAQMCLSEMQLKLSDFDDD